MTRQNKDPRKDRGKDRTKSGKPPHEPASRETRLAAALRENLRRRKAQERGRDMTGETPSPRKDDGAR